MNEPDAQTAPNYVTCPCQHCGGKIEFDANQFDPAENTTVPCPHCKLETTIFVPEQKMPPVGTSENVPSRQIGEIENGASASKQNVQKNIRALGIVEASRRAAETWLTQEETRRAAERGDHLAQWSVGMNFSTGRDVAQDYQEAVKWFRKAAEQGNALAQLELGWAYLFGKGVAADHSEAAKWMRLSAEQGNDNAQSSLGDFYRCGAGIPKDLSEAIKWYRLSAEQGNADAQFRLGLAYLFGHGAAKDYSESTRWERLSAEQGNASAQLCLSVAYSTGEGVPQNYVEAYKWANLAAAQGKDKAKEAKEYRDELTPKMTPSQIEEGQRLSSIEALRLQNPKNQTRQEQPIRMPIPSEVRREVWRRDGGVCVKCGSRLNLEYDHIVPVSKGGSNTARNIELLCQDCNRAKSASIK